MDASILHDPVADMVGDTLRMDVRHQVLPDGEFIRWLRRISGYDNLFLYYHRDTMSYVLAQWVLRSPRYCVELDVWDTHPDRMPRQIEGQHYWHLRLKTDREVKAAMAAKIKAQRYEEKAGRRESAESRQIVAKSLKRKGLDSAAELMAIGATPHIGEREAKRLGVHGMYDFLKPKRRKSPKKEKSVA